MTRPITAQLLVGALAGVLLLTGCAGPATPPSTDTRTAAPGGSPPAGGRAPTATELLGGLTTPWGLATLRDGSLLVSERDTRQILRVDGDTRTVLRTIEEVRPGGEGGLLGLAVTPDERRVFAYYTAAEDNRVVVMDFDGRALGAPQVILDGIPKAAIHNGGRLLVGPDGFLYVGTGEAGQPELAQDRESLGGKILRVTLDGQPAPDNPFGTAVFSLGHRNVQGLAFDGQGRLWACEFGSQEWDELNLVEAGHNYGWPLAEGSGEGDGLANPEVVWPTSEASPSGLAYWQGELWMAGLRGERLWEIPVDGTEVGEPVAHLSGKYGRLRSVIVANDGQSLLLTGSNTDGRGDATAGDDRLLRVTR